MPASAMMSSTVEASMFNTIEGRQIARHSYPFMQINPTIHRALSYTGIAMSGTADKPTGPVSFAGAVDYIQGVVGRDESVITVTTMTSTRTMEISQPTLTETMDTATQELFQPTSTETSMTTSTNTQEVFQLTSTDTTTVTNWFTVEEQSSTSSSTSTTDYPTTIFPDLSSTDDSEYFSTLSSEPSPTEASTTAEYTTATSTTDATSSSTNTAASNNGTLVLSDNNKWALEPLSAESRKHANWAVKKLVPGLVVPSVIFDGGIFFFLRWMHGIKQRVNVRTGTAFSPDMTEEAYETATRLVFDAEVARHKTAVLKPHTNEAAHKAALKLQEDVAREALEFVDTGFRGNHDSLTSDDMADSDETLARYAENFRDRDSSWREELERSLEQGTLNDLAGPAPKPSPDEYPSEPGYPDEPEVEPVVEPEVAPVVPPGEVAPVVVPPEAVPVVAPGTPGFPGFPDIPIPDIHLPGSDGEKDKDKDKKKDGKGKNKDGKKKVSFALTTMLTTTKPSTSTQESTTASTTSSSTSTSSSSTSSSSTSSTSTSSTTTSSTTTSSTTTSTTPTPTPTSTSSPSSTTPTSHIETTFTHQHSKYTFTLLGKNWPRGSHGKPLRNELRQCKGKSLDHWKVHSTAEAQGRGDYDFWVEGRIEGTKGFPKRCFQEAVKQVGGVDPWAGLE